MKFPTPLFLGACKLSLHLYPRAFRHRYAEQLLDAARLQQADAPNDLPLAASLAWDTLRSALREHLRAASPTRPGYVAAFALFFSFLLLSVSILNQQILRRGADRTPAFLAQIVSSPQLDQRSETARARVVAGILAAPKQEISSPTWLNSASTFVALYDASGNALAANATLQGHLPQPPRGIFDTIRSRHEFRVTWQPRTNIRVALTGLPMPNGGFVLAGQSLIVSESREIQFHSILLWMWAFAMIACCMLVLLSRMSARKPLA